MRSVLCLALVLSLAASAAACPPVAISGTSAVAISGVQTAAFAVVPQTFAFVQPQVQVQTFAVPSVAVQSLAVQSQAVVLAAPVCVQAACAQRAQRVGILGRLLGGSRSLSISRSVSR